MIFHAMYKLERCVYVGLLSDVFVCLCVCDSIWSLFFVACRMNGTPVCNIDCVECSGAFVLFFPHRLCLSSWCSVLEYYCY